MEIGMFFIIYLFFLPDKNKEKFMKYCKKAILPQPTKILQGEDSYWLI